MTVCVGMILFLLFSSLFLLHSMFTFKAGSLNINGGRDAEKRAIIKDIFEDKALDILFLQETHSDVLTEAEWALWWRGQSFFSHGTVFSAGVAVLFSPRLSFNILSVSEVAAGRFLAVRVELNGFNFCLINFYAPAEGAHRIPFFLTLEDFLKNCDPGDVIVMGGDWNCTLDFTLDRTGAEPHFQSSSVLSKIVSDSSLVDVWRLNNPQTRQYTWARNLGGKLSLARLDRFYITDSFRNRVYGCSIHPVAFSDHHLITLELHLGSSSKGSSYWHFNVKLLLDRVFCEKFEFFWELWRCRRSEFVSVSQWWEVGKAQIRVFCQQYTSHSTVTTKRAISALEKEISGLENTCSTHSASKGQLLKSRRGELSSFLRERAKGALVRARFTTIRDMDAPTSFIFNLQKSVSRKKQMVCLRLLDGTVTTSPAAMRTLAVDFYSGLFGKEDCDSDCVDQLMEGLPRLSDADRDLLDSTISMEELTAAVGQMALGKSPGLDGLPADFYKHFWKCLGPDLLEVFKDCSKTGLLPFSCRHAVLSLLPKKGDLTLLKNWRPLALLCTDYKLLSKVLSNRLKNVLGVIIHRDQSYCVPDRSIMDNLFLVRDLFDVCKHCDTSVGLLSLDQEKAFDRVDHSYLFSALRAFGFGEFFTSLLALLYKEAFCLVKIGGGLSRPVMVQRGIRQGCPLSGQLYAIAIEPFLHRLRTRLIGLMLPEMSHKPSLVVSAYADDVTVFVRHQADIDSLCIVLDLFQRASSARVNWGKSTALLLGRWSGSTLPLLPGNLNWGTEGMKFLGVYLGSDVFQKKNWEGVMERVCARLSKWKYLLLQLSFRGRVLVVNNLVASTLWHSMMVLPPPASLITALQKTVVDFFWSGHHWLRAAVLYLPVEEGGQGLIDISARVAAFRLRTAQRLLHGFGLPWLDTACVLLRKAGGYGFDKHLFLPQLHTLDLTGLSLFYCSVLQAWRLLLCKREMVSTPGIWLFEEPIFGNDLFNSQILVSATMRSKLRDAGCVKLGHLLQTPVPELSAFTGIRSLRTLENFVKEICLSLPVSYQAYVMDPTASSQWVDGVDFIFPPLKVSPACEGWQEDGTKLLSWTTPQIGTFETIGKKSLYFLCVKVLNLRSLMDVRVSRWAELFGTGSTPRGCWRSLYKAPVEKRVGDLQWRVVHGIIATNRYLVHLNPGAGDGCPFCSVAETVEHLFLQCQRLTGLFSLLRSFFEGLGEQFSSVCFIYGPKYLARKRRVHVLLNFLSGEAKLAVWLTRKNRIRGVGSDDVLFLFKRLLVARLNVEFGFYRLTHALDVFENIWAVQNVLCSVKDDSLVVNL
uniref:Reverse transcriptase domain-containing protein n=1 Tax=Oryzias latipes TaxID=8090 RepID=A0A3P9LKP2_ORYLA